LRRRPRDGFGQTCRFRALYPCGNIVKSFAMPTRDEGAETAAMPSWALFASGVITMRRVNGWQTLAEKPDVHIIDLAA